MSKGNSEQLYRKSPDRRKKLRSGFTLAELLLVVAITLILAGLAFVAVIQYNRRLKMTEMNATAKEIFIAAQNHLTALESSGKLEEYQDDERGTLMNTISDAPGDWDEAMAAAGLSGDRSSWESAGKNYYVLDSTALERENSSSAGGTSQPGQGLLSEGLLPFGAVDETVLQDGSFIIEYDYSTASVYGVFYTDEKTSVLGRKTGTEIDASADLRTLNSYLSGENYGQKNRADYKGCCVGYYGGAMRQSLETKKTGTPVLKIENGDVLAVRVTDTTKKLGDSAASQTVITLRVRGLASGASAEFALSSLTGDGRNSTTASRFQTSKSGDTYTIILDDITNPDANSHFASLFSTAGEEDSEQEGYYRIVQGTDESGKDTDFIPGEDLAVSAECSAVSDLAASASTENGQNPLTGLTNSLFGALDLTDRTASEEASGAKTVTAEIASFRHLENLDPDVSGVIGLQPGETQVKGESPVSGLAGRAVYFRAVQTKDLCWTDSKSAVLSGDGASSDSSADSVTFSFTENVAGYHAGKVLVRDVQKNQPLSSADKSYYSICNNLLISYSGDDSREGEESVSHAILNLNIDDSDTASDEAAGLFSEFGGKGEKEISFLDFRNLSDSAAVKSKNDASYLVGRVNGSGEDSDSLTIWNVTVENMNLTSEEGNAGGFAAYAGNEASLTIQEDREASAGTAEGNETASSGSVTGTVTVSGKNSASAVLGCADGYAGGIAGSCLAQADAEKTTLASCTVQAETGGFLQVEGQMAGGAVGKLQYAGGTVEHCLAQGGGEQDRISGTVSAGGFAGTIVYTDANKAGILEISDCAASLYVQCSGTDGTAVSAGGFAGSLEAVKGSTIDQCQSGGRTQDGKYSTSKYNVSASGNSGAAGGFIGRIGSSYAAGLTVSNSYTTSSVKAEQAEGLFIGQIGGGAARSNVILTNTYATGLLAEDGGTKGYVGQNASGQTVGGNGNYYLGGINTAAPDAVGSNSGNNLLGMAGATAGDGTGPFSVSSANQKNAVRYDAALPEKYPYQDAEQLAGSTGNQVCSRQTGDWPVPEKTNADVNTKNGNRLVFETTVPVKPNGQTNVIVMELKGTVSGQKYYIALTPDNNPGNYTLTARTFADLKSTYEHKGGVGGDNLYSVRVKIEKTGTSVHYIFYLDDISLPRGHFTEICPDMYPGEDVEIKVANEMRDPETKPDYSQTVNGLFDHVEKVPGSDTEYVAYIANSRNLENLDQLVSGVNTKNTDKFKIVKAVQTDNIYWNAASTENVDSSTRPFAPDISGTGIQENSTAKVMAAYGQNSTEENCFQPIANSYLEEYDGGGKTICHLQISGQNMNTGEEPHEGGLFRFIAAGQSMTVHDLNLLDSSVVNNAGNAGTLIGHIRGGASVVLRNISVSGDDVTVSKNTNSIGSAGGIIGLAGDVNGRSVSLTMSHVSYQGKNASVTGSYGAGGLAGAVVNAGVLDISDCSASAYVRSAGGYSDGSVTAAGGLFGVVYTADGAGNGRKNASDSTPVIERCYAGGKTSGGSYQDTTDADTVGRYNVIAEQGPAGGFVGKTSGSLRISQCFTTASVRGGKGIYGQKYTGGFSGYSMHQTGKELKLEDCYAAGLVSSAAGGHPGAFIGTDAAVSFDSCYYLNGINGTMKGRADGSSAEGLYSAGYNKDSALWASGRDTDTTDTTNVYDSTITAAYPLCNWTRDQENASAHTFTGDWQIPADTSDGAETRPVSTGIAINPASWSGMVNSTGQLSVVDEMSDGAVQPYAGKISWSSSDNSIVSVDKNGKITLNSRGTASITATAEDGKTAQCPVTVFDLYGLEIDPSSVSSLPAGTTVQLHAYAITTDGTRTDVTDQTQWSSNKEDVATVTSGGLVTLKNPGNARITAQYGYSVVCTVSVPNASSPYIQSIGITGADTVSAGSSQQMSVSVKWSNRTESADSTKVTWSVSDTTIGSIDSRGNFTGNKAGQVTLTAGYNGLTAVKTVTVVDHTGLFQTLTGTSQIDGHTVNVYAWPSVPVGQKDDSTQFTVPAGFYQKDSQLYCVPEDFSTSWKTINYSFSSLTGGGKMIPLSGKVAEDQDLTFNGTKGMDIAPGTIYKRTETDGSGAQAVSYWIYPDPYNPNYVVMPGDDGSKWVEITDMLP